MNLHNSNGSGQPENGISEGHKNHCWLALTKFTEKKIFAVMAYPILEIY